MRKYLYGFKRFLFYLLILFLLREVFIKTEFGKAVDIKNKDVLVLIREKCNKIFDFSVNIPHVERPQISNVDIPEIKKSQFTKTNIPKTEKVEIPKVNVPKIDVPKIDIPR